MNTHDQLWKVTRDKKAYETGEDTDNHRLPDCAQGCKWFVQLEGELGNDWGVCIRTGSPRAGLLTFEHMGCPLFEEMPEEPVKHVPTWISTYPFKKKFNPQPKPQKKK